MSFLQEVFNNVLINEVDDIHQHYQKAKNIVRSLHNTMDRDEIIDRISKEIDVSLNTAQTYYYRAKNELFGGYVANSDQDEDKGDLEKDEISTSSSTDDEISKDSENINSDEEDDEDDTDPDRQGIIRTVDGAHLVYKRQTEEGTYEELWIYNIDNDIRNELTIRQNILAGTDIPPNKTESEDGNQEYTLTTLGNAQLLNITGLPN